MQWTWCWTKRYSLNWHKQLECTRSHTASFLLTVLTSCGVTAQGYAKALQMHIALKNELMLICQAIANAARFFSCKLATWACTSWHTSHLWQLFLDRSYGVRVTSAKLLPRHVGHACTELYHPVRNQLPSHAHCNCKAVLCGRIIAWDLMVCHELLLDPLSWEHADFMVFLVCCHVYISRRLHAGYLWWATIVRVNICDKQLCRWQRYTTCVNTWIAALYITTWVLNTIFYKAESAGISCQLECWHFTRPS